VADPFSHRYVLNVQLLIPARPRDGDSAIGFQAFRLLSLKSFEVTVMAFVNEVVSDADIAKYNLPFKPGAGRYWTRDKERDCYLWGGIVDRYAFEYDHEGQFDFYWKGVLLRVFLALGKGSESFKDSPYRIVWNEVTHVQPCDFGGLARRDVLVLLKNALTVYGYDGRKNIFAPNWLVTFNF
jgi:hypothetical protein